jgi:hypothetical protein
MKHIGNNPQALARLIESLGGSIVDDNKFAFPVNITKDLVPRLGEVGIGVDVVQERVGTNLRTGKVENVVICAAYKRKL